MKVRLRQRLQGKSNKSYLYLEYYKGAHVRPDGKTIYKREYEYLDLYLIDNPNNATEKKANAETLQFAEELRVQREVAIKNGKFSTMTRNTKSFLQYLDTIVEKRKGKKEFYNWRTLYDMLLEFSNGRLTFEMLDKKFCADFRDYLINKKSVKTGEKLKPNTAKMYWSKFVCAVNMDVLKLFCKKWK